jgi:hypothetical protein
MATYDQLMIYKQAYFEMYQLKQHVTAIVGIGIFKEMCVAMTNNRLRLFVANRIIFCIFAPDKNKII